MPQLEKSSIEIASRGGYTVVESDDASITLVSTGSEVSLCLQAAELLQKANGVKARVVSMPCMEVFDTQTLDYQALILPAGVPIMSVEAASTQGWDKYSHVQFGINRFGESAPCDEVFRLFEMTPAGVAKRSLRIIEFYKGNKDLRSPVERPFEQIV